MSDDRKDTPPTGIHDISDVVGGEESDVDTCLACFPPEGAILHEGGRVRVFRDDQRDTIVIASIEHSPVVTAEVLHMMAVHARQYGGEGAAVRIDEIDIHGHPSVRIV